MVGLLLSFFEGEINPLYAQAVIANLNLDQLVNLDEISLILLDVYIAYS